MYKYRKDNTPRGCNAEDDRVRKTAGINLVCICLLSLMFAFHCAACTPNQKLREADDKQRNVLFLLKKTLGNEKPLSICIAEALPIAARYNDRQLAEFCRKELMGYSKRDRYEYRCIEAYCPLDNAIPVFREETFDLFYSIEEHPKQFRKDKLFIPQAITVLEKVRPVHAHRSFIKLVCRDPVNGFPADGVYYARGNSYLRVVAAVREEFIKRLTRLLHSSIF